MNIKNNRVLISLLGLGLVVGSMQAEARGGVTGYVTDSSGNIVHNSSGECWHSGSWTSADATVVGCDGVVLDAPIEVLTGQGTGEVAEITIPAATMFAFDKSNLTKEGRVAIESYRQKLRPELTTAYSVIVIGHTDSTGSESHNQKLSFNRAVSVAKYLVSTGLSANTLRVIGRGSKQPLVSNNTRENRSKNRRVEIIVVAEVRALDTMLFPSAALFERRSGDLSARGKTLLEKNRQDARLLLNRATYVEIVGHTDDVGDDIYNMNLSRQRAQSVLDYLVSKGLDSSKVVITAMGESIPIATNNTPEGRTENRRVEILILGRLK